MEYQINGDNLEVVSLQIGGNEMVYGEAGSMSYISGNVQMSAEASGGFMKGLKRKFSGESFFLTEFTTNGGTGIVAFSGQAPGRIVPLKLQPGVEYIAQKDAFLCAESGVDLDIETTGLGKGLFGGEGLILQRLSGNGLAFIHVPGDLIEKELQPNQVLKVSTGHVAAFEPSVEYDVQRTGGIKSSLFSGEGLFMTTLQGPGKIWLQSMTLQDLAASLNPYISSDSSGSDGPDISFG
ncbi:MAG: TIGR00266 family protein [Candidatus Thermoplasmatota archaeon]|nr:TIGR00266 family protein [Candidatus Thermoplasmatota archaeon]